MTAQAPPGPVVYLAAVSGELPNVAQAALGRIEGDGRELLAARSYLRAGAGLVERWSWTDSEIAAYRDSDEARAALAELEAIKTRFAERNPGYTLYVNAEVRSLDVQIARWNENDSVRVAADELLRATVGELARYPAAPTAASTARFAAWLRAWRPARPPLLAAPGLSPHGRSRAFDFQVQQGAVLIAGADAAHIDTVWDGAGWTRKLAEAVAGSAQFRGPLASPREPWHYEYVPEPQR